MGSSCNIRLLLTPSTGEDGGEDISGTSDDTDDGDAEDDIPFSYSAFWDNNYNNAKYEIDKNYTCVAFSSLHFITSSVHNTFFKLIITNLLRSCSKVCRQNMIHIK